MRVKKKKTRTYNVAVMRGLVNFFFRINFVLFDRQPQMRPTFVQVKNTSQPVF